MQTMDMIQLFGFIILGIGILLIVAGCAAGRREAEQSADDTHSESKGMILIGPIPIVWGFGRRGWLIAGVIGAIILLLWIIILL